MVVQTVIFHLRPTESKQVPKPKSPPSSAFSSEDTILWHVGTLFEDPCTLLSPTI